MQSNRSGLEKKELQEGASALIAEAAGKLFRGWGLRGLLGRTWTLLFLSSMPLDAESLQRTLDVSTGSMNTALRELVEMGLVYRQAPENRRRFHYRAENDLWTVITRMFKQMERGRFEGLLDLIKQAESLLSEELEENPENKAAKHQLDQVRRLVDVGAFVIGVLDVFMARTKMELKAAQKWIQVSERLGGDPIGRLRNVINANIAKRKSHIDR